MSWVKFDDKYTRHPKVLALSDAAFRLNHRAIEWASDHLTDGLVTTGAIKSFVGMRAKRLTTELVTAKLWEEERDGYRIHDYLEYQPSKETVLANRAILLEKRRKAGVVRASSAAREGGRFTSTSSTTASTNASKVDQHNQHDHDQHDQHDHQPRTRTRPVPEPNRLRLTQSSPSENSAMVSRAARTLSSITATREGLYPCVLTPREAEALVNRLLDDHDAALVFKAIESLSDVTQGFTAKTREGQIGGIVGWVDRQRPPLLETVRDVLSRIDGAPELCEEAGIPDDGLEHASNESLNDLLDLMRQDYPDLMDDFGLTETRIPV